ncbi:MAG: ATP-dependent metallopeptidase FtsH/Yme1/Tma family protein, partial [Pseudomonadota bacterium]
MGNARNFAFWIVLFLLLLALFRLFSDPQQSGANTTLSYSDFVSAVESGSVSSAVIDGERITFEGTDQRTYTTVQPVDANVSELLIDNNVAVQVRPQEDSLFTTLL